MERPSWLWCVFIFSILYFLTGLLSGGFGLLQALYPPSSQQLEQALQNQSVLNEAEKAELEERLRKATELAASPRHRMISGAHTVARLVLACAFLAGAIRLFRFEKRAVSWLKTVYLLDILLVITGAAQMQIYFEGFPAMGGAFMLAGSLIYVLLLDGIPLLCLFLGDKSVLK